MNPIFSSQASETSAYWPFALDMDNTEGLTWAFLTTQLHHSRFHREGPTFSLGPS